MAKDYNQVLLDKGYTQEQIDAMTSAVSSGQNAMDVVRNMNSSMGNTQSPAATQNQTSSSSSGWSYVYNPTTWYYEQQTTPSSNRTTPTVQQQTTTTQTQNTGSTVTGTQQQGALKPLSQDYYNQTSDTALSTIRDNLNRYRQTNPEYFTDYDSFKRNFSYDTRNDEQKNVLDTWYKWYQQSLQLSTVPTTDLYTQYQAGQVSAADLESLRISNPEKYAELQTQINRWNIVSAYNDNKGTTTEDMFEQIKTTWLQNTINNLTTAGSEASNIFDSYEQKMNSPEMLELSDQSAELQEQMENLTADIDSIKKTVEAEYAGTGASRAKINAIISDRTYDLQLQLRTLNSEYNKYATQYNNRMQQYQTEFNMELQEYQLNMQARNQQMSELGFAMDLMSFETPEQAQEREWNYRVKQQEYANGDINSKDYSSRFKAALNSVQNLLSQYSGIPMQRSAEQMAEDILKDMEANGTSLGDELTKINKQIQSKPEYKMLYNQTYGYSTWASGLGKIQTIWGREYVEYNGKLYTSDEFNSMFGGTNGKSVTTGGLEYTPVNPYQLQWALADWMNSNKNGTKWGQCGKFVNDYLQTLGLGRLYGNSIASKTATINVDAKDIGNLSVWSVAVFDYSNVKSVSDNAKKYGHVAIVTEIDQDRGRVKLIESNLKWDEKVVSTRWVDINSPVLKGYFDPSKGSMASLDRGADGSVVENTTTIQAAYNPTRVGLYNAYIQNGTMPSDAKLKAIGWWDLATGMKIFDAEVESYMNKTGVWDVSKTARDEITNLRKEFNWIALVKDYNDIKNNYSKIVASSDGTAAWDLSMIFAYMKLLDPGSVVREWEFANAQNAAWIPDRVKNLYNKALKWTRLTDAQRKEFINTAGKVYDSYTEQYNQLLEQYKSYVTQGGDANSIGTPGTYVTEEYKKRYNQTTSTYSITNTNFYQKYANTAAWAGSIIQTSYGTFYW